MIKHQLIKIIPLAIKKGIGFDYLLIDSWFTCFEQVKFIITRRNGCRLLGGKIMVKRFYAGVLNIKLIDSAICILFVLVGTSCDLSFLNSDQLKSFSLRDFTRC